MIHLLKYDSIHKKFDLEVELSEEDITINNNVIKRFSERDPSKIKLVEIINAVDEKIKTVGCNKHAKKGCTGKSSKCITHNLWDELEIYINNFFEKKNLSDLINRQKENRI